MTNFISRFLIAGVLMAAIDFVWLGLVANNFYRSQIGNLLLDKPNLPAAVSFYVLYVVGIVLFVINPAIEKQSWQHALTYGFLFGLIAYATYDLTNLAVAKGYTTKLAIVDMAWGSFLTALVAVGSYWVVTKWIS
ncbi:MAG: DUF2177 family protein [bacterium]|nr:DUF2177 family protein [bacterium]